VVVTVGFQLKGSQWFTGNKEQVFLYSIEEW
jgi:hypothetical protein